VLKNNTVFIDAYFEDDKIPSLRIDKKYVVGNMEIVESEYHIKNVVLTTLFC